MTGIKYRQHEVKFQYVGRHPLLLALFLLCFYFTNIYNTGFCNANEINSLLTIEKQGLENQPGFYVHNRYNGPVEVEFHLTRSVNIISSPALPARFVVPGLSKTKTFTLSPSQSEASFSYAYQYSFTFGSPKAVHQPPKPYNPPFPSGNRFRISRSFKAGVGSASSYNAFAVNILIAKGVPVCAARSGIVMDIVSEVFTKRTSAGNIKGQTELVRVLHDDGTMGIYAHLKSGSLKVNTGMEIKERQVIGEPGISASADMPYLYFAVQKNTGMSLESIPFEFEDSRTGKGIKPARGMVLRTD